MNLKGYKSLVTGGAKRIGKEFALHLANSGADVAFHYFKSEGEATTLEKEIRETGSNTLKIKGDFVNFAEVSQVAKTYLKHFETIDILVNNASTWINPDKINGEDFLASAKLEDNFVNNLSGSNEDGFSIWDSAFAVNARAPFFLSRYLLPYFNLSNNPSIINILDSSVSSYFPSRLSHSLSKQCLLQQTEILADYFKTKKIPIRINALQLDKVELPEKFIQGQTDSSKLQPAETEPSSSKLSKTISAQKPSSTWTKTTLGLAKNSQALLEAFDLLLHNKSLNGKVIKI